MSDIDYYRDRLAQEAHAANMAKNPAAEAIHRSLATAYARKALAELERDMAKTQSRRTSTFRDGGIF